MKVTYDPEKNDKNIRERGLSFDDAAHLDWDNALVWEDTRFPYGEIRHSALADNTGRVHFVAFMYLDDGIRVISFRKANKREVKLYEDSRT